MLNSKKKPNNNSFGFSETTKVSNKKQAKKLNQKLKEKLNEAMLLINQGKLVDAETIYRKIISKGTESHIVYGNLASLCGTRGNTNEMISLLKQAIRIKPNYIGAHYNLGNAHKQQGNLKDAILSYKKALELNPNYEDAHNNLGTIFLEQGNTNAAVISFQNALRLNPKLTEAHYNLGNALKENGDLDAAIISFQKAIKFNPNFLDAHTNLAATLQEAGDINAAITSFEKALKLNSNYLETHHNLAHALLLNSNYEKGWLEYEYRFRNAKKLITPYANPIIPQWHGESLKIGDKLLIISEQGLGDTIQFMRYIPYLRKQGIDVSLCAQTKLHDLIIASDITSNPLTPEQANKITSGKKIPLLSLPLHLRVNQNNPIVTQRYIYSRNEFIMKWKNILSVEKKPIIGINWQGNPQAEKSNLKGRSIPLELFSKIAKTSHLKFLSLQKGFGSEQLENCSFIDQFVSCQAQVNKTWNFLETAAIISNCDLVITCDTSIAHLAGGMNKKTWLLLKDIPDWRWGLKDDKTFWYPSMRLFRQKKRYNWEEVIERVSRILKKEI